MCFRKNFHHPGRWLTTQGHLGCQEVWEIVVAIKSLKLEPQRLVKFLKLAMILAQAYIYEMSNQKGIFYKSMNLIQERNKGRGKGK